VIKGAPYDLEKYSLDNRELFVRRIAADVALIAYEVHEDVTVGQHREFDAFDTTVWVRRDGTWRCALHTETLAGDAYGGS
jgi:hypothetical protein